METTSYVVSLSSRAHNRYKQVVFATILCFDPNEQSDIWLCTTTPWPSNRYKQVIFITIIRFAQKSEGYRFLIVAALERSG